MRNLLLAASMILLSSFDTKLDENQLPKPITRTSTMIDGKTVEKTVIVLDGTTSREDVIHTCNFLAQEKVLLTFDKLSIGKSFLGVLGKQRIRMVEGMIQLPNGTSQPFKAGGINSFRRIKIQYTNSTSSASRIEMIEIVD
jgi:hypothetical protein